MNEFRKRCPRLLAPRLIEKQRLDNFLLTNKHGERMDRVHHETLTKLIKKGYYDEKIIRCGIGQSGLIEDIGCGVGNFSRAMATYFPNVRVRGLDPEGDFIKRAKELTSEQYRGRVKFRTGGELETLASRYDKKPNPGVITATNVLYNVDDLEETLTQIRESLVDGGVFMFQELDPELGLHVPLNHWTGRYVHGERSYKKHTLQELDGKRRKIAKRYITMASHTKDELESGLKDVGFTQVNVSSMEKYGLNVGYAVK